MGAGASVSLCQTASSVRVLKQSSRVEPESRIPEPDPGAVFGVPLSRLRDAGKLQQGVPLVLRNLVEFLEKYGLQQSGVFRVCGSAPRCRTLRMCLDHGEHMDLERGDVPIVASLLKLYLRELPCGLIPNTHSKRMQQALRDSKDGTELSEALKEILTRLPDDNYNILSYLLHFLSRVAAHSQWNHMTSENLATVFGPCIFRVPEGPRMLEEQTVCNTLTLHLLEKHSHLIPDTHTHTPSGDFVQLPPHLIDMTQIQEEHSCNQGTMCGMSVEETKEMRAHLLITAEMQPLSNSGAEKENEAKNEEKEERIHPKQESFILGEDQSCFAHSDTSPSLLQCAVEPPSPKNNNNNAHLYTHTGSNTDTHSNNTHSETHNKTHSKSRKTHSPRHTHTPNSAHITIITPSKPTPSHRSEFSHTLSESSISHTQSNHTPSESSHTLSESSIPHTQSNHTHSESNHTLSESSISHTQSNHTPSESNHTLSESSIPHTQSNHTPSESNHTHTAHTYTKEEPRPASICEQPSHKSRAAPVWKATSAHPPPHCLILSQNQHISSKQDSASSSQSHIMSECISTGNCADSSSETSIALLQHHIHSLKQAIRSFDDSFQHNHNYKAGHSDKTAEFKVASLKMDLCKARKQLKELRSRQRADGPKKSHSSSTVLQAVSVREIKPALEDTVKTLTQHLKEKRKELNLPDHVRDMSWAQLALEKMTLQKSLLYYESLHGRPRSREERSVMRELYDRYRSVKQAFYTSNKQTNTTGKHADSDICIQQPLCSMVTMPAQEDSNPAFILQLEEEKQPTAPTNDTQAVNRAELLRQLRAASVEKRRLRKILKEYEETVLSKTGRSAQKEDRVLMAAEYDRYKTLKARLKLLKSMLGKTHTQKAAR